MLYFVILLIAVFVYFGIIYLECGRLLTSREHLDDLSQNKCNKLQIKGKQHIETPTNNNAQLNFTNLLMMNNDYNLN